MSGKTVSAKEKEFEDINGKAENTKKELTREEQKLQGTRKEASGLEKEAERFRPEIQTVKQLRQTGLTLEKLKSIDKLTKKFGGFNAVIGGMRKYKSLNKLDREIASKEEKRVNLDSEIRGKKQKRDTLSGRVRNLKDAKSTLESSVEALKTSTRAFEDAKDGLKTEIGRLKSEKTGIENELKPMRRELADTPQQIEKKRKQLRKVDLQVEQLSVEKQNLEGDVAKLSSKKKDLESEIEKDKIDVKASKAIVTLLTASGPEGLKQFKEWVDELVIYASSRSSSEKDVEVAKWLIFEKLMGKFRAYKCNSCDIRFVTEGEAEPAYGQLACPNCHSTSVSQDFRLPKKLNLLPQEEQSGTRLALEHPVKKQTKDMK